MATNTLTMNFQENQTLTVNSTLLNTSDGYEVSSTFAGVTISGSVKTGGKPGGAGWHDGPVWLDLTFTSIQFNAMVVLQVSGTATTPNGASQIAQFTVLANSQAFT